MISVCSFFILVNGGRNMDLYEAIYLRRTSRHFRMEIVDKKILDNILNFTKHLEMIDENQQVQFEIIENKDDKRAPYFLVLSAVPVEGYLINAGFLMQQVMLYIMTKGIGSCFMKYHKLPIHTKVGFEPVFMLAFGYTNKSIYREAKKSHRLSISEICRFKTEISEDMKRILEAGRLAPSYHNNQPWRFVVYENRIHLFCRKSKVEFDSLKTTKNIDLGIALANLYLAAEELWYSIEIKRIDNICERTFTKNNYVISVILQR